MTEIYNFTQDDLMTEDIFIVDCHSEIFVWVGQEVAPKNKLQALTIGEVRFLRYNCKQNPYLALESISFSSIPFVSFRNS